MRRDCCWRPRSAAAPCSPRACCHPLRSSRTCSRAAPRGHRAEHAAAPARPPELPGEEREPDVYAPGVRFCGKWVLRAAIVAMGLKVQTCVLRRRRAGAHRRGRRRRDAQRVLRRARARGAARPAPPAGRSARRWHDDLWSLRGQRRRPRRRRAARRAGDRHRRRLPLQRRGARLPSARSPRGSACSTALSGIWSGLAVNDLSSAVAVGAQMGGRAASWRPRPSLLAC